MVCERPLTLNFCLIIGVSVGNARHHLEEPGRVRVSLESPAELDPGSVRVRTLLLRHLRRHRADRLPRHQPLSQPKLGPEPAAVPRRRHATPTRWPAGATQEVGEVVEVGARRRRARPVGQPRLGHLGPPRPRPSCPPSSCVGHALPAGARPARRRLRPGRRDRAQRRARRRRPPRRRRSPSSARASSACSPPACAVLSGAAVVAVDAHPGPPRAAPGVRRRRGARRRARTSPTGRASSPADRGRRRRHRAQRRLPGPARGDPDRSARTAGSSPPASTRATASGCGSARSSTTTGCSSSASQIGGGRRRLRAPLGRPRLQRTFMEPVAPRQARRHRRWSATRSPWTTRPQAYRPARHSARPRPSRSSSTSGGVTDEQHRRLQEQLLPGRTLQEKCAFAVDGRVRRHRAARPGRLRTSRRGCPSSSGRGATASSCRPCAWTCRTSSATSTRPCAGRDRSSSSRSSR